MLKDLPDSSANDRKIFRELFKIFPRLRSGSEPLSNSRPAASSGFASLKDLDESISTSTSRDEPSSFKHVCKWLTSISACAGTMPKIVVRAINEPAMNAAKSRLTFFMRQTVQQLEEKRPK